MKDQLLNIYAFVPDCYKNECCEACYAPILYLVQWQTLWTKIEFVDLQPPSIKRQPGRPKKKRNMEAGEMVKHNSQLNRAIFGIKCSMFHKDGYNAATCKLRMPQTTPNQSGPADSTP